MRGSFDKSDPRCTFEREVHWGVASHIRERRLQVGMTQQLGQIIGVAFQPVHRYEIAVGRVTADCLYRIATAIDAAAGYFFARGRPHKGGMGDQRHRNCGTSNVG